MTFLKASVFFLFFSLCNCLLAQERKIESGNIYDIFPGDYADPTILRDGKHYYMTHSTSNLVIWQSDDLLHWKPISRALPMAVKGLVWAPELIKYKDKYFIYYPMIGKIFVVWATRPEGPWSQPVSLDADGIDPGVITTADGKRYLYINDGKVAELSENGLSLVGEFKKVYNGWQYPKDWAVECFCLESPKLIFRQGYYYMISAEGGTSGPATSHMAVVARSKSPLGPWEDTPNNPLVHTYQHNEAFVSKGHGTVFSDEKGDWYIVYHAYKKNEIALGRHTLIEKIKWTNDAWPYTTTTNKATAQYPTIANTSIRSDNFSKSDLKLQWIAMSDNDSAIMSHTPNGLQLKSSAGKLTTLQAIVPDTSYEASIQFTSKGTGTAGLIVYYNNKRYIGLSIKEQKVAAVRDGNRETEIDGSGIHFFKLRMTNFDLSLLYSEDGIHWETYPQSYEMSGYQTNVLRDFGSLRIAVFAEDDQSILLQQFNYQKK